MVLKLFFIYQRKSRFIYRVLKNSLFKSLLKINTQEFKTPKNDYKRKSKQTTGFSKLYLLHKNCKLKLLNHLLLERIKELENPGDSSEPFQDVVSLQELNELKNEMGINHPPQSMINSKGSFSLNIQSKVNLKDLCLYSEQDLLRESPIEESKVGDLKPESRSQASSMIYLPNISGIERKKINNEYLGLKKIESLMVGSSHLKSFLLLKFKISLNSFIPEIKSLSKGFFFFFNFFQIFKRGFII